MSFIESSDFPAAIVSAASEKEKQIRGMPPHWLLTLWWTRKPLAGARAVIAAALLPKDVDPSEFVRRMRLDEQFAHRKNPRLSHKWKKTLARARLLDPFAGFGSIPLEAARLGLEEVVAVDLLPTAYVFLKAILEHPKAYGRQLVKDVKRWGKWIVKKLERDPVVRGLYESDVYVGTWEARCPRCGRWTPLVADWWLTKERSRDGTYKRLVWMVPVTVGKRIEIKIVDLREQASRAVVRDDEVAVDGKTLRVPARNVDLKKRMAFCLHCNVALGDGIKDWYVKEALQDWNKKLEQYLDGQIDMRSLRKTAKARPTILVKVNGNREALTATREDRAKLWRALRKLKLMRKDPDLLIEPTPYYDTRHTKVPAFGFDKYYKFYNPRQLLITIKLIKLIRRAGKKIEREKRRQGWDATSAHKYAEAVTTYLAMALYKYALYNCLMTSYDATNRKAMRHAVSVRGFFMTWNWTDLSPLTLEFAGSYARNINSLIYGLSYLVRALARSKSKITILRDDATTLSKLSDGKFDVIVTDPPFKDDISYTEISDFYYVLLKRALSDVVRADRTKTRRPRFMTEAFYQGDVEIETQWMAFADKEVSENRGRAKHFGKGVGGPEHFKELLARSFERMAELLSDGGVIVMYFAHTSPQAWEALLEAGWRRAGLRMTTTHTLITEMRQRIIARGKESLNVSVVTMWRKGVRADDVRAEAVEKCVEHARALAKQAQLRSIDIFVGALSCVLSVYTKYKEVLGVESTKQLVKEHAYPAALEVLERALGTTPSLARQWWAKLYGNES